LFVIRKKTETMDKKAGMPNQNQTVACFQYRAGKVDCDAEDWLDKLRICICSQTTGNQHAPAMRYKAIETSSQDSVSE